MYVKSDFIVQKYLVICLCQYHGHYIIYPQIYSYGINSFQFLSSDVNKNSYVWNFVHKCVIFVLTGLLPCRFGGCSGNYSAS